MMKPVAKQLAALLLPVVALSMVACAQRPQTPSGMAPTEAKTGSAQEKTASGTIVIDEYQIMWVVGGDIGGGTLKFRGRPYKFKMDGVKLGGFGAHQVKLTGDVYDLDKVEDFEGVYGEAEVGYTVVDADKGDFWLENEHGVKLRLKSPESKGVALDLGVEGVDIRLEK
jgi:hypothetical protein